MKPATATTTILASCTFLALVAFACDSVPDVTFVDGGVTGAPTTNGTDGSVSPGTDSGTVDAGVVKDAAVKDSAPANLCDASGVGAPFICCDQHTCIGCNAGDCTRCENQCGGAVNQVCCPKNPTMLNCHSAGTKTCP